MCLHGLRAAVFGETLVDFKAWRIKKNCMLRSPPKLVFLSLHMHSCHFIRYTSAVLRWTPFALWTASTLRSIDWIMCWKHCYSCCRFIRCTFTRWLLLHHILKAPYFYCNLMVMEVIWVPCTRCHVLLKAAIRGRAHCGRTRSAANLRVETMLSWYWATQSAPTKYPPPHYAASLMGWGRNVHSEVLFCKPCFVFLLFF